MLLRQIAPPAAEPVSLADAKLHLRVTASDQDTLIAAYLAAAREQVEQLTHRALMLQTWELRLPTFWHGIAAIDLPMAPLNAVQQIEYVAPDGIAVVLAPAGYIVEQPTGPTAPPGSVSLGLGLAWPAIRSYDATAVRIRYQAGYPSAADVPAALRAAVLLLLGDLYENREGGIAVRGGAARGTMSNPTVDRLLGPYRLPRLR